MNSRPVPWLAVVIAAFGYFVDLYDIAIFGVVRVASLTDLGLTGADNTAWGIRLLNLQMVGLFIGGLLWGVVGDKFGRRVALIATILCYSLANIANAFVTSVEQYAVLRFVAGVGLAGELGAGVALVSEILPSNKRGYGVVIIALLGMLGSITAAYVGGHFEWRNAFLAGGIGGLIVFVGRLVALKESGLFEASKASGAERGDLRQLFASRAVALRLLCVIAVGIPVWFVAGLLIPFTPEFGKALGFAEPVTVSAATIWQSSGVCIGMLLAGLASERFKSRKRVIFAAIAALPFLTALLFAQGSRENYLHVIGVLGLTQGYWSVYLAMGAEQFGTNIRAMTAISIPNFVRVTVVPITLTMGALAPLIGWIPGAALIGGVVIVAALVTLSRLRETYDKDLDYLEPASGSVRTAH